MATPDAYLLVLPTGNEGPFTPDELRDLLRRGRARASDRIYHPVSLVTSEVRQVVSEADALEQAAARPSDRIVRSNSDRHQAVAQAQAERRRTSDRLPTAAAPKAQPKPSDRQPAVPPAEAAPERRRTSDRSLAAQVVQAEIRARRRRMAVLGTVLVLTTAGAVALWWPTTPPPPTMVWIPPSYPALTPAELRGLAGNDLLRRVSEDSLRRVANAQRGWNCGPEVLTPLANAVWTIHRMERNLSSNELGLEGALASDRSEVKPPWPSLAQLAAAYDALEMPEPARILRLALQDDAQGRPNAAELEKLDHQLKAALGPGSNGRLIAALTKHKDEILAK
jgi:hypothetical protein